jgi:hypothetical protein
MLFGRRGPDDAADWRGRGIHSLVAYIDGQPAASEVVNANRMRIEERIQGYGLPLTQVDLATIRRFHDAFIDAGLGLRFNSFGRAPQPYYPTLRQLILETDLAGNQAGYLADEGDFRFVKSMQERNLIVPVVGDLAGDHAVSAIGEYLREIGEQVSAFYTSNVEFYIVRDGGFRRFVGNVADLPRGEPSVIIRSFFGGKFRSRHPQAVPGYYSTQLLQTIDSFAEEQESGGFPNYLDLVTKHSLTLR